jgi:hypothetical protein
MLTLRFSLFGAVSVRAGGIRGPSTSQTPVGMTQGREQCGISNGLSADASKMMRRLLRKGGASARGRKPGSLRSADSGRDDTKIYT